MRVINAGLIFGGGGRGRAGVCFRKGPSTYREGVCLKWKAPPFPLS